MELRTLRYFLAVAREQSIVKAAKSLHLSQPTLSVQIKNMEAELGKKLLVRGSKGSRKITLTEEGMILKKRAEEIFDLVQKTENEISLSDQIIKGDIYIGTGETDAIRHIAETARKLQKSNPGIHYHISSGNAEFVMEHLDKGLIDFGIVFGPVDMAKYNILQMKQKEIWGVIMKRNCALALKETISPEDLWDKPLILSQEEEKRNYLTKWMKHKLSELNVTATYNLLFNASLLVNEGLGYAISFDKIINTSSSSNLCFRPLAPKLETEINIIWKKYQVFSKPAEKFLEFLKNNLEYDTQSTL